MGIFSAILDKLRHHGSTAPAGEGNGALVGSPQGQESQQGQGAGQQSAQSVDVGAVLSQLAAKKAGGGNYSQSIVDLLKLLDLDSSLTARKELARELDVRSGADGSAEQNIALHKAVMRKLEENGGKLPESMKH